MWQISEGLPPGLSGCRGAWNRLGWQCVSSPLKIKGRWLAGVVVLVALVAFHNLQGYLGYFEEPTDVQVETKAGGRQFVQARTWRTLRGDLIIKDKTGTHRFKSDAVLSVFYSAKQQ